MTSDTPMPPDTSTAPTRIALASAADRVARGPQPFATVFARGDLSVELFAPRGPDTQRPHAQDEIYFVAAGSGLFRRGEEQVPFGPGDFLFVPAGVEHRFERFSDDFKTWVVFFGPPGGQPAG